MAQDDFIRTALRVPPALHQQLHDASDVANRSFNAEIIARLEDSFKQSNRASEDALQSLKLVAQLMAQFVVTAVDLAGPQPPAVLQTLALMRDAAQLVRQQGFQTKNEPMLTRDDVWRRLFSGNELDEALAADAQAETTKKSERDIPADPPRKITKVVIENHDVQMKDPRGKTAGQVRTIPVEVRKKRTFIKKVGPPKP